MATTQKPKAVMTLLLIIIRITTAMSIGASTTSNLATEKFGNKKKIKRLLNADFRRKIFTSGTTQSINLVEFCK